MDTLFEAEIFFIITSAVVIAVGIVLIIGLLYLLRIMRNLKEISKRIKSSVDATSNDFDEFREDVKKDGLKWKHLAKIVPGRSKKKKTK